MGIFSCFAKEARPTKRDVHSAPPSTGPRPEALCTVPDGRRSAPATTTVQQPATTGSEFSVAEVFGDAIIRALSSEKWDSREEALQSIEGRLRQEALVAGEMTDRMPLYNACCCILRTAMNDKVAPVYFASCKLLSHLVSAYGKDLNPDDIQAGLVPLMNIMLARTGESNQRVLECTCSTLLSVRSYLFFHW